MDLEMIQTQTALRFPVMEIYFLCILLQKKRKEKWTLDDFNLFSRHLSIFFVQKVAC